MKTIKMLLAIAAILVSSISAYAQQVDLTRGDLSILKEENSINIEFTYDKMTVGDDGKEAD